MRMEEIIKEVLEQHKIWLDSHGKEGKKAILKNMPMSGLNLKYADLRKADLSGSDLKNADLSYAYLRGANLNDTDLTGANLKFATLIRASLRGANLSDADLRNTDLTGADLINASLYRADLRDTKLARTVLPERTLIILGLHYSVFICGDWVRVGCKVYSANEWRQFSMHDISEMHGLSAVKFYPRLLDIIDLYCGKGDRPEWLKKKEQNN